MNQYAIIVTFHLKPGKAAEFKPLILENAVASVRDEGECFQFHVTQKDNNPDVFILYEVYKSASSIDIHTAQPHYKKFRKESEHLVDHFSVDPLTVLNPANLKA